MTTNRITDVPFTHLRKAIGDETPFELRVRAPEWCQLTADAAAAATSLAVRPLPHALASGDKLIFGENTVVTLSGAAAAGVVALPVSATPGPLSAGDVGQKLRDLTGFTLVFEALSNRGDATPLITISGDDVTIATQTGIERGKVQFTCLAAKTASLSPSTLYWSIWRRNVGSARPEAEGDLEIYEAGGL